jgi:hypothetical protein
VSSSNTVEMSGCSPKCQWWMALDEADERMEEPDEMVYFDGRCERELPNWTRVAGGEARERSRGVERVEEEVRVDDGTEGIGLWKGG